jgi:phage-related protein
MKPLKFIGSSLDELRDFPLQVRRECGRELNRVQNGLMPTDWKPMLNVGNGAYELRIHMFGEWRIIYLSKTENAIYVLHAFQKKSNKTPQADIELAKRRYKLIGD